MRNIKKQLFTVLLTCVAIMSLAMTSPSTPLAEIVNQLSEKVKSLTTENLQLKYQNSELRLQVAENFLDRYNDRIALEPIRYFTEEGYDSSKNPWAKNPDHLRNVWKWVKIYKNLLNAETLATAKDINVEYFAFCWFQKETHYNPHAVSLPNKDGTIDWGMAQINDRCWNTLYSKLPEELKKRKNPKMDAEIATCMLFLWMNDRTSMGMSWAYLSDTGWTLYWRISQING